MAKKTMILCGSPKKKGNTNTVVRWIKEGLEQSGGRVEVVDTAGLNYEASGCMACMKCQGPERFECVIKDDAAPILARIPENDVLIFATPLYFFGPTAQLKLFMDRMYSLFKFRQPSGGFKHHMGHMTFALVSTAGGEAFGALEDTFKTAAKFIGVPLKTLLIPFAGTPGSIKDNNGIKERAFSFARSLL